MGETHGCSCPAGAAELCEHVLFVLVRVFRMQLANPLVWQVSAITHTPRRASLW